MPHIKRCQNPGTNWLFFVLIQNFGSAESYISCDSIKTCSESESDHNPQLGKRKYNQIYSFAYQNQFEKRFANARTSKKKKSMDTETNNGSCVSSYSNSAANSSSEGLTCEKAINKEVHKNAGETDKDHISDQSRISM
ncbi:uncharacterized protein LOC136079849 isoform X3 [Hydra vulgaris]|uniref:Uncharacterized protein LOC136079849 isoform X3 n=1 Tax=Hydra vulgaris TaxID=6087 RepID=A0ABM4BTS3_HYDVU